MPSWTEERVATLREMWGSFSASEIARSFGDGTTRNTVIGKAFRLGLHKTSDSLALVRHKSAVARAVARLGNPGRPAATSVEELVERRRSKGKRPVAPAAELPRLRAEATAEGHAIIAKVEAEQRLGPRTPRTLLGTTKDYLYSVDASSIERIPYLSPARYRPTLAVDNPGVVAREEPEVDLYAHMRSEPALRAAMAAMTRPASFEGKTPQTSGMVE